MRRSATAACAISLAFGLSLAGCDGSGPEIEPPPSATVSTPTPTAPATLGPLGQPGCAPTSPRNAATSEIQGTPEESGTSLYGMVFQRPGETMSVGADVKVVWRMTGDGDLTVRVTDPHGIDKPLAWGPEAHGGSTYHRPGDEWGTGLTFDAPGCWELSFSRDTSHANVWVDVAP